MFHSSYYRPRVYPINGDITPVQIDRLQTLSATPTLNREKIREIGRDGIVDWRQKIPSTRVTAMQYEYGSLEFYRKIANKSDATTAITLADFKDARFDIAGFKTDDLGAFKSTIVYPGLRTAGFGFNIGDPQAYIERTFDFIGEDEDIYQNNNKYYQYKRFVSASPGTAEQFTMTAPFPFEDNENSGKYIMRVTRYTPATGVTTELSWITGTPAAADTTRYGYNTGTHIVTVNTIAADVVKVYYTTSTSSETIFTNNDTSVGALSAEMAEIKLYVTANNTIYKLQSLGIDISFDRSDYYEIGNANIVQRGVKENTARFTLGRILDTYTIEEVARGITNPGHINNRKYLDSMVIRVKFYSTAAKTTFLIGLKATGLSPVSFDAAVPTSDYLNRNAVLECDNLTITSVEGTVDA